MFIFYFKAFSPDEKCGSRNERCPAAGYDNGCVFTPLVAISVLAGASRCTTLALTLGRRLQIPADSALKIFAFIYPVGESKFDFPVLFSAVFVSDANPKKQIFLYVFRPQTSSVCYKSAIRGKTVKKP